MNSIDDEIVMTEATSMMYTTFMPPSSSNSLNIQTYSSLPSAMVSSTVLSTSTSVLSVSSTSIVITPPLTRPTTSQQPSPTPIIGNSALV